MKITYALITACWLSALSTASIAGPEFPGLKELGTVVQKQEVSQKAFSKALSAWWRKNSEKPASSISVQGLKIKLPGEFIRGYLASKEGKQLKQDWKVIEKTTLGWSWGASQSGT